MGPEIETPADLQHFEALHWNIVFLKWQKHIYDYEIVIWNIVSDSSKSKTALVRQNLACSTTQTNVLKF